MPTNVWIWVIVDGQRTTMKSLLGTVTETRKEPLNAILKQLADAIGTDTYQLTNSTEVGNNMYTVEFGKKINGVVHPEHTFESVRISLYTLTASLTTMIGSYSPMQIRIGSRIDSLTGHDIKFALHYFGSDE